MANSYKPAFEGAQRAETCTAHSKLRPTSATATRWRLPVNQPTGTLLPSSGLGLGSDSPEPLLPPWLMFTGAPIVGYLALTLEVIDAITSAALLNATSRFSIRW